VDLTFLLKGIDLVNIPLPSKDFEKEQTRIFD
jgi:hypothetical protein